MLHSFHGNVTEYEGRNHKTKQSCQKANRTMLLRTKPGDLKGTTHQNANIFVICNSSFYRRTRNQNINSFMDLTPAPNYTFPKLPQIKNTEVVLLLFFRQGKLDCLAPSRLEQHSIALSKYLNINCSWPTKITEGFIQ